MVCMGTMADGNYSMKQPAVFMIGWEYPPYNSGGLGVACEGLTKALSTANTQIYFTLPYRQLAPVSHMKVLDCYAPEWFEADGTPRSTLPPFLAYSNTQPQPLPPTGSLDAIDSMTLRALPESELESRVEQYSQVVTQHGKQVAKQFDVIHAHDWMSFPAALQLQQATHKPVVAHIHSTEFDRIPHGHGSHYIMHTEYQSLQQATKIIAVSYYTKQLLVDKYKVDPAKIEVVHNGIDPLSAPPSQPSFMPQQPVVVFMGRLTMQKGGEYFLQLASKVLHSIPNALFVVAGSGDMYHQLLFKSAYDQLSTHVLFSGFVRDRQKDQLLDRANVFVMPSISEPFGLVALEAAQRHTPVIISSQSGVAEVLPGAIVCDFWDVDRMADHIVTLLNQKSYAQAIVDQQLRETQQLTWNKAAAQVQAVYQKAMLGQTVSST